MTEALSRTFACSLFPVTSSAMLRVAVVGGSIGGLAAARVFHRLGASVKVFEKSPSSFEGRGGVRSRSSAVVCSQNSHCYTARASATATSNCGSK